VYEFLSYRVEDAMSTDLVTIRPDATVAEAEAIFEEHDFNALPVVDDDGRLVGILTKLDLLGAFRFTPDRVFPPYERIMHRRVGEPLTRVLEILVRTRFKSLVVLEDRRPVGMIAREDVLRALRRAASGEGTEGEPAIEPL